MPKRAWVYYSDAPASNGRGPFGPTYAETKEQAERVARARLAHHGLVLDRVELLTDPDASDETQRSTEGDHGR